MIEYDLISVDDFYVLMTDAEKRNMEFDGSVTMI